MKLLSRTHEQNIVHLMNTLKVTNNHHHPKQMSRLTQVPVGQRVVIIVVVVVVYVLLLLAAAPFVLEGDSARLVEARLDVLLAVGHSLVFLHITLHRAAKNPAINPRCPSNSHPRCWP